MGWQLGGVVEGGKQSINDFSLTPRYLQCSYNSSHCTFIYTSELRINTLQSDLGINPS